MKKRLRIVLCVLLLLSLSTTAFAAEIAPMLSDANTYSMSLSFLGGNATCNLKINGATGTTKIDGCTVTLKEVGGSQTKQWTGQSAQGSILDFSKSASGVSIGKTYELSFSATVHRNGKTENISGSIKKTYN